MDIGFLGSAQGRKTREKGKGKSNFLSKGYGTCQGYDKGQEYISEGSAESP